MRGFIVLCLTAVAVAAPQGYNYNPGQSGTIQQSTGFGGSFGVAGTGGTSGGIGGGNIGGSFIAGGGGGAVSGAGGGSSGFFQGGQQQQSFYSQSALSHAQNQQQQALVSKRFYIHSAPEDVEEDFKEKHITVGTPKKNYNVVFIKSPQRSHKKTSIKISPAVNEEKTVIYVLSKKADISDVQAEVVEHAAPTTKPEVFFIKYKTNEEAAHAQQQIQAQYDALGGSSQVTDEGVAPVTSVIGALGGGADGHADGGAAAGGIVVSGGAQQGGFNQGYSSSGIVSHGVSTGPAIVSTGGSHGAGNTYLPPGF